MPSTAPENSTHSRRRFAGAAIASAAPKAAEYVDHRESLARKDFYCEEPATHTLAAARAGHLANLALRGNGVWNQL